MEAPGKAHQQAETPSRDRLCAQNGLERGRRNSLKTVTSRGTIRRARRAGGLRGAAIQFTLGHGGQLLVRRFFLVEILLKQCRAIVAPEFLCPRDQRAIARDLIVLDRLRRSDERGIQNRLVLDLARDLFGLVDDAVDGGAIHPPRLLAAPLEAL